MEDGVCKRLPALQALLADNNCPSFSQKSRSPPAPLSRALRLPSLSPPHPLTPPPPFIRGRAAGLASPRAGRCGTIRDVMRPRLNQTQRLGNFKLKGGATRALGNPEGRASGPVLGGLTEQDGGGRGCGGLRAGPAAQQQVRRPDPDRDPSGASGVGLSRRVLAARSRVRGLGSRPLTDFVSLSVSEGEGSEDLEGTFHL